MGQQLKKQYDDRITILYVDVIDDDLEDYPEIESYLAQKGMKLPLVTINGVLYPELSLNIKDISAQLVKLGL